MKRSEWAARNFEKGANRDGLAFDTGSAEMTRRAIRITILPLKRGLEEILIPELTPIIDSVRQFKGCLVFDLYRISGDQSVLVLHEVWEKRESLEAFAISPLKAELIRLASRFLAQPLRSWLVEEVC